MGRWGIEMDRVNGGTMPYHLRLCCGFRGKKHLSWRQMLPSAANFIHHIRNLRPYKLDVLTYRKFLNVVNLIHFVRW
jgi:hypothetical protein